MVVELLQVKTRRNISKRIDTIDMAINEAQILKELERGGLGADPKELYSNIITDIANDLIEQFTTVIEKNTKTSSSNLKQSVKPIFKGNGFEIEADYYYKFIDDGVSGVGGGMNPIRSIVTSGLYKFKNLGVPESMAQSIREWSGASIEQSYAIGINIKRYGIEPKNITDTVITDAVLERIAEDLATVTGLNIEARFNKSFDVN